MKKLKINLQVPIITECWSFYRLSILSTSKQFQNWFLNHFNNLTMDLWTSFRYGRFGKQYNQLNYYNDLLETKSYNINNISNENQLYDFIKTSIEDNNYILLECDVSFLFGELLERDVHEIFIYGYDENNICCVNIRNGVWKEDIIDFHKIKEAFFRRKNLNFDSKSNLDLSLRSFLYPITLLKLRNIKIEPDLFSFRNDIRDAFNYSNKCSNSDNAYYSYDNYKYWEGACNVFYGLIDLINGFLEGKNEKHKSNIVLRFKKLYEYHNLLIQKIRAFDKLYNINIPDYLYDIYNSVIESLDICFALSIKYRENGCNDDLLSIKNHLIEAHQITENVFGDLLIRLNEYLIKYCE